MYAFTCVYYIYVELNTIYSIKKYTIYLLLQSFYLVCTARFNTPILYTCIRNNLKSSLYTNYRYDLQPAVGEFY